MTDQKDLPPEDPVASDGAEGAKAPDPKTVKLDLLKMDLSVEEVEERISPSETNVFDK